MARKSRRKVLDTETMTYSEAAPTEEYTNKTAIYARLSRENNGVENSTSLDNQIEYISNALKDFSDINVVDVYSDNGFSGVNFNRKGWEQLIEDIKQGKINCIAVKDLSRLGRNSVEAGNYLEKIFPFLNVRFISINDNYDNSRDSYNKKMVEAAFKNIMNEFYVRDISKKVNAGIKARRSMGYITASNVGYGYKKSEDSKGILPDENAPVVSRIFKWRRNGKTIGEIANILNFLAIPSPGKYLYIKSDGTRFANCKDSKWFTKNIRDILSNRVYTGALVQNKTHTNKLDGINRAINSEEELIIVENHHTALVSKEDFDYIQSLKRTIYKRPEKLNYLKGKVYCGKCGYDLKKREVYSDRPSFNCQSNRTKLKELCRISISEKRLNELLRDMLGNFISLFVEKSRIAEKIQASKAFKEKTAKRNKDISALKNRLRELEIKIANLYEDYKAEIIGLNDFEFIKLTYNKEYSEAEERLNKLIAENSRTDDFKRLDKKLNRLLTDKTGLLDDEYIYSLVKRITVYSKDRIEIEFTFADTFQKLNDFIASERENAEVSV